MTLHELLIRIPKNFKIYFRNYTNKSGEMILEIGISNLDKGMWSDYNYGDNIIRHNYITENMIVDMIINIFKQQLNFDIIKEGIIDAISTDN